MKQKGWLLALIIFTIPAFISLLRPGLNKIQDSMQYFRIYEMDQCLTDGQIPCRWVPDMGYGFGYPLYIYYSPGPYYLGSIIHSFGFQYIDSVKILFIGGFIVSTLGMFFLIQELLGVAMIAWVSSLIYIYAPVRAVQVYVRGSLGEFLSMAIFPWIFLYSYRLIKSKGRLYVLGLGVSLATLFLTHNLMTIAFMPILLLWIVYWYSREKNVKTLKKLFFAFALGVGLAAFYVVPLIFERGYVHLESLVGGYFDYRQHFVNLYQLFISNQWGYGSSWLGSGDDLSLSAGQIQWIGAVIAVILAALKFKKERKKSTLVILIGIVSLFYIFLTHQRSAFIWENYSFMSMFQFPWRFLIISTFLLSLMSSYGFFLLKGSVRYIYVVVTVVLLFVMYGSFFKPQVWSNLNDKDLLSGEEFVKQQTASIFDYLPKSAVKPPNYQAPVVPEIVSGEAVVNSYSKGSDFQQGKIDVESIEAGIRLPIFDFPGMTVTDNNEKILFNHTECSNQDYCFGQISFDLKKGVHNIRVQLDNTWPRQLGDIISGLSIVSIVVITLRKKEGFL